jgi:hypothetical protein
VYTHTLTTGRLFVFPLPQSSKRCLGPSNEARCRRNIDWASHYRDLMLYWDPHPPTPCILLVLLSYFSLFPYHDRLYWCSVIFIAGRCNTIQWLCPHFGYNYIGQCWRHLPAAFPRRTQTSHLAVALPLHWCIQVNIQTGSPTPALIEEGCWPRTPHVM